MSSVGGGTQCLVMGSRAVFCVFLVGNYLLLPVFALMAASICPVPWCCSLLYVGAALTLVCLGFLPSCFSLAERTEVLVLSRVGVFLPLVACPLPQSFPSHQE